MSLELIRGSICELGKIKIGGKEQTERQSRSGGAWRAPEKWDHFKVTTMNRERNGDLSIDAALMERLKAKFADKDGFLRQIPIALLSNDIDDVLQCAWCWYPGKCIGARSDGETLTWFVDPKTKTVLPEPRTEPHPADFEERYDKLFKLHTVFSCVILADEARWGGVYRFRTTSKISADQLKGSLLQILQLTGGVMRGLPMMMVVRPKQVAPDGKVTTVHVVHCELRGADLKEIQARSLEMARFELEHKVETAKTVTAYRKLLTAPGYETPAEQGDIATEFPDAVDNSPPVEPDPLMGAMGMPAPPTIDVESTPAAAAPFVQSPEFVERMDAAISRFRGIEIGVDEMEAWMGKRRAEWNEADLESLFAWFVKEKKARQPVAQ